jgi:hypothetical protein
VEDPHRRGGHTEQRCHLSAVWLAWLGLPLLALVVAWRLGAAAAVAVLLVGVVAQVLYLRPEIIRAKGLRSVPVMEVDGRLLVGNATSKQMAEFIGAAAGVRNASG